MYTYWSVHRYVKELHTVHLLVCTQICTRTTYMYTYWSVHRYVQELHTCRFTGLYTDMYKNYIHVHSLVCTQISTEMCNKQDLCTISLQWTVNRYGQRCLNMICAQYICPGLYTGLYSVQCTLVCTLVCKRICAEMCTHKLYTRYAPTSLDRTHNDAHPVDHYDPQDVHHPESYLDMLHYI